MPHALRLNLSLPSSGSVKSLEEKNPQAVITSAVAAARVSAGAFPPNEAKDIQGNLIKKLNEVDFTNLTKPQKLGILRAYALTFIRFWDPDQEMRESVIANLDPHFPSDDPDINTELIRVLTYLQSPTVVEKAITLIANRGTPEVPDWTEIAARKPGLRGHRATLSRQLTTESRSLLRHDARQRPQRVDTGSSALNYRATQRSIKGCRWSQLPGLSCQHSRSSSRGDE